MDMIANMLTTIYNAGLVNKESATTPYSKIKISIAKVLAQNGFLQDAKVEEENGRKLIRLTLKYESGKPAVARIRRISKPGLRVYAKVARIPKPKGGMGILILSTPAGILTGEQAVKKHVGGEIICEVVS